MTEKSSPQTPSREALRELAESRGVHPTDDDLDAVAGFLDAILPALERLERELPADTVPAGPGAAGARA